MKKCIKVLAARNLERFKAIILAAFSLPCSGALSIFIIIGHLWAYDYSILSFSWRPSHVSPIVGIIYIFLIICSVLAHELGHLAAAVFRGDSSAEVVIQFNSRLPVFMTKRGSENKALNYQRPILNLSGIYFQLFFASFLGFLFFLTHEAALPASVLLIDVGVLASLVPTPGTDGYWFLIDLQQIRGIQRLETQSEGIGKAVYTERGYTLQQSTRIGHISFALGISLLFLYLIASIALFLEVGFQLLEGAFIKIEVEGYLKLYEILGYMTLLIPAMVYAFWAVMKRRFVFFLLRHLWSKL